MRSNFRLTAAFLIVLLMVIGDTLDSFGLSSAADERGARVASGLAAPFYGRQAPGVRESIAVVLISDASLDAWDSGPPPPYRKQADLIFRLVDAGATAVFFDFLYRHPRETPADLAYLGLAMDVAASRGVPVFTGPRAGRPEFAPLQSAGQVDLGWRAQRESDYPFLGGNALPTAAAALYEAVCATGEAIDCDPSLTDREARADKPALSVQWGAGVAEGLGAYWRRVDIENCPTGGDLLQRALTGVGREIARGAVAGAAGGSRCFYHLTAPAHILLDPALDRAALAEFASGRAVLIGSAYEGSADIVNAPGFGRIPGVMQHAMALDNLLTFQSDYRRWPAPVFWELDLDDLVEALLSLTLIGLGAAALNHLVRRADALDGALGETRASESEVDAAAWRRHVVVPAVGVYGFITLVLTAPVLVASATSALLHWPPANAIGVALTVIAVGLLLVRREQIASLVQPQILRPVAAGAGVLIVALIVLAALLLGVARTLAPGNALILLLAGAAASVILACVTVAVMRPRTV